MWPWRRSLDRKDIDGRLFTDVKQRLDTFQVHAKELPQYRFVDLHRAAERHCHAVGVAATIESDHRQESLSAVLHSRPPRWISRRVGRSEKIAWPVGLDEEVFLPADVFWVTSARPRAQIARMRYDADRGKSIVEVACPDASVAEASIREIVRRSEEASVYRNRVLALRFKPASQPSLVILEDVDLVFTARDINAQGSILGELLDQMDGLRPHEDVGFVLTTNAIDRIEAAIKDRPGRISQCIHLGPPGSELRRRYLLHYLAPYASERVDLDALVTRSDGATQAFLKDWVHRAVQIATERLAVGSDKLELRTEDFAVALREARGSGEGANTRIIGFLKEPSRPPLP